MGNIKLAKTNYKLGFDVISQSKFKNHLALSYQNLAFINLKEEKFDEAEEKV